MITDEIMAAIDLMIMMCTDQSQKNGMETIKDMLGDLDENTWMSQTENERIKWIAEFFQQPEQRSVSALRVIDTIESFRKKLEEDNIVHHDEILRIVTWIIADMAGYKNRVEWTEALKKDTSSSYAKCLA
jgi:hypothetical protein